jgi:hypothetical protein
LVFGFWILDFVFVFFGLVGMFRPWQHHQLPLQRE